MAALKFIFLAFLASLGTSALARVLTGPVRTEGDRTWQSEDSCRDCTQIFDLFTDMISNADTQEVIQRSLDDLCKRLPTGEAQSACLNQVEKYLPIALHFMAKFIKPGEMCMVLGLCVTQSNAKQQELLTNHITADDVSSVALGRGTLPEGHVSPSCTFCIFLIKKLESMLPKERTEEAVVKMLDQVCSVLPESVKEQCEDFINKYGKEVIDFLLSSAAPHTICVMLHLCLVRELPLVETPAPNDCESCQTLAVLSQLHLGPNTTEHQTSSFLGSVCLMYPFAVPKCEVFTQRYGPRLQRILGKQGSTLDMCGKEDLCVAVKEVKMLGADHCTWGNNYRCRDMKMALECNSVQFCQKFVWN
ncbi:hypothetical protein MATL_G00060400 [Megalops atlanticus]|uniref:Pulmonary surfactant-associated protein B n=1 Tax=Megalops atlanticus TaxID=7932 RepID=A0A9D3TA47_MEGAT|nr:hypothetical protein MATL_G00060400 [Megalops atlanticus]